MSINMFSYALVHKICRSQESIKYSRRGLISESEN